MPAAAAVSTMPVPRGTLISRPSIDSATSSGVLTCAPSDQVQGTVPRPWPKRSSCAGTKPTLTAPPRPEGVAPRHVWGTVPRTWPQATSGRYLGDRVEGVLVGRGDDALERRLAAE